MLEHLVAVGEIIVGVLLADLLLDKIRRARKRKHMQELNRKRWAKQKQRAAVGQQADHPTRNGE